MAGRRHTRDVRGVLLFGEVVRGSGRQKNRSLRRTGGTKVWRKVTRFADGSENCWNVLEIYEDMGWKRKERRGIEENNEKDK